MNQKENLTNPWQNVKESLGTTFMLLLLTLSSFSLNAQIVINEILPDGTVELKNIGTSTVDVSGYWLCDFPAYQQLSNSSVQCGDLMLLAGETVTVNDFNEIAANDGEMGLYTASGFSNSNNIIDYVEWGSSGHQRASVAAAAGIWIEGIFVPAFSAGQSLSYSGSGDGISSWTAGEPTICPAPSCDAVSGAITLYNGDTSTSICVDGIGDPLDVVFTTNPAGSNQGWVITDTQNNILGLPMAPPFDLDGAGEGTCLIWAISYESDFAGAAVGANVSELTGCFSLSNSITVYREAANGGTVATTNGETTITATAGNVIVNVQHTTTAPNLSYWYIITDNNDNILGFMNSANGNTLDLSGAPAGECHIWGWSYRGEGDPIIGDDISTLADGDCEAISDNWITVIREEASCDAVSGAITLDNGDTSTSICVDGIGDPLDVVFTTNPAGSSQGWVITDTENNILGLPMAPPFDLDGAGEGTCLIWAISYEEDFAGAAVGANVSELTGCFSLSNSITVYREAANGGTVATTDGETTVTATAGNVIINVQHTTTAPNLSYWYIITDNNDNILGFMNSANGNTLDLSGAPAGECHIWGWSYRGEADPVPGDNISTLADGDCEAISDNWITVIREEASCDAVSGAITLDNGDTSTSICVDGIGDPLDVVFTTNPAGSSQGWVITDTENNILGLPMAPPFDLDGAGEGTCLIWAISYESDFAGAAVGANVSELTGCFSLSNSITVYREAANGGTVATTDGETTVTATAGNVIVDVQHTTTAPNLSYWYIITDNNDNILGFMNSANGNTLDLSGAPAGECHIWGWSYRGEGDPIVGDDISTLADGDCEAISDNWITVIREEASCDAIGGAITLDNGDTSTSICVDGIGDPLDVVFTTNPAGSSQGWVITDTENNILGLPMAPPFNLDGAGEGTCLIWAISYESDFAGAAVGANVSELTGCFSLSNSITVYREAANGGTVATTDGETTVTATAGNVIVNVQHTTTAPNLSYWYIITDNNDNILGFMNSANGNTLDLSGAPAGECHIWGWSYRGEGDPVIGDDISTLADGDCEAISDNFITVIREEASCDAVSAAITLDNGDTSTSICVDGNGDPLDVVFTTSPTGSSQGWVITDTQNNILGLPMAPPFDLDGAGVGTCLIWAISYEEDFAGAAVGANVSELTGCFSLSNSITVYREAADGGTVSLTNGDTSYANCAGDIVFDVMHTNDAPNLSYWYIITDNNDDILAFHNSANGNTLDLSGAPAGECHIWGWSYRGLEDPIIGDNISTLADDDCEAISDNWITVYREIPDGGYVSATTGATVVTYNAGDVVFDVQHTTTAPNLSYWYIITDNNDNILAWANSANGNTLDLSAAPAGECHIWGWNYRGLDDPIMGENISTLADDDCEAISHNWITVIRTDADCDVESGSITLANGETTTSICVDGNGDPLDVVFTEDPTGTAQGWVITDTQNNILGLPMAPPFDLDGAGVGTCLIWAISYEEDFAGAAVGVNVSELTGCFNLSNPLTVIREAADGGMVYTTDGETTVTATAGDVIVNVQHSTDAPNLSYWYIITDNNDNILGFLNSSNGNTLDLSGAPAGECHIWGWSYRGEGDPIVGDNISTLADGDCEAISDNFITVIREEENGGGDTDLSLTIGSMNTTYDQYQNVVYTLIVTNDSDAPTSGVVVSAALPQGMVFTSASTPNGSYNLFFEEWTIGTIPAGETAVLNLTLFPLASGQDINTYAEIIYAEYSDSDSTPNNGNGVTPNEDDEAALNLPFNNGDGGVGNGDGSIDLELSINADVADYTIYENVTYSITITNNGQDAATDVVVNAALPAGMVYTESAATQGEYSLFFEEWTIDNLGAGESATLDLTLFPLVTNTAITNFVEVFAANQTDTDSTPGNGNGVSADEDDEAVLTLENSAALRDFPGNYSLQFAAGEMTINHVYPNPTFNELNLNIISSKDADAVINLVNIQGKILQSFDRTIIMGVTEMSFDVSNLPTGRYFIQVLGVNGYRQAQSFVKQ